MHEREVKGLLVRRSDDDLSWPEGGLDPGKGHARLPNLEDRGHLHQGQQQMGWCDPEAVPQVRLLQMGL